MLIERNANYTDFDFIYSTLLNGARHGHYAVNVDSEAMLQSLKDEIHSITRQRCLLDGRFATASIFSRQNQRIAVLITSQAMDDPRGFEIYALSVAKKYRDMGYGSAVLDLLMNRLYRADITARCSEQSVKMQRMLEMRGFKPLLNDQGFTLLKRQVPAESGMMPFSSDAGITTENVFIRH